MYCCQDREEYVLMYTNKNSNNICRYCIEMWNNLTGSVRPYSVQYTKKSNFLIIKIDFYSFLCGNMHSNIVKLHIEIHLFNCLCTYKVNFSFKVTNAKRSRQYCCCFEIYPPPKKKGGGRHHKYIIHVFIYIFLF